MLIIRYLSAFLIMFLVDYLWGIYVRSIAERKPMLAAIVSGGIFIMGGVLTVQYVEDHFLILPAAIGGAVGTYLAVSRK